MSTQGAQASKPQSEQGARSVASSQKSIPVHRSYERPTLFSELHRAYGQMRLGNHSQKNVAAFKRAVLENGLVPGPRFDKALEDPEPQFSSLVREIENFRSPPRLDWVKDAHEPQHPRYRKKPPVAVGTPQQEPLRALAEFERDQISKDQLRQRLGEADFRRIEPALKNAEDGKFTGTAHQLVLDQDKRHQFNASPVRNSAEVFGRFEPPSFGSIRSPATDSGPLSTVRLARLAQHEAYRKTAKLVYAEVKGTGAEFAVARENNGDIIRWTSLGRANDGRSDRYAINMKKPEKVHAMASESQWSRDLARPPAKDRRDFRGNGNIITWMG